VAGDDDKVDWTEVEAWVTKYGEDSAENYIKEHYKALGYASQSAALAGWENHLLSREDQANAEEDARIAAQVTNKAAHDWIRVNGFGRLTWQELEVLVDKGEIEERYNEKTGKYTYVKKNLSN